MWDKSFILSEAAIINLHFFIGLTEVRATTQVYRHYVSEITYLYLHIPWQQWPELWLWILLLARSNFAFTGEKHLTSTDQSECFYFICTDYAYCFLYASIYHF